MLKVKKTILISVVLTTIMGCSSVNPPKAKVAQGNWENVITTSNQIKAFR